MNGEEAPPASAPDSFPEAEKDPRQPLNPIAPGAPEAYAHLKSEDAFVPEELTPGDSLASAVKKLFWASSDLGEPRLTQLGGHAAILDYDVDGSVVRISFEYRPGTLGALSSLPATKAEADQKQRAYEYRKKVADEQRKAAVEATQARQAETAGASA